MYRFLDYSVDYYFLLGMAFLRIAATSIFSLLMVLSFSNSLSQLPLVEDPVLMTVWGESIELETVNYFCRSLKVARDYSPEVTLQEAKLGAGFGIGYERNKESFHPFYTRSTPYKTIVVIAGGEAEGSQEDISRIVDLVSFIKEVNGIVYVIDIDVESKGATPVKAEFFSRVTPYVDVTIFAETNPGIYKGFTDEEEMTVIELSLIVDLSRVFEVAFGGGRCCD